MAKEKNLGGRPKTVFTDKQIAQIEALAACFTLFVCYFHPWVCVLDIKKSSS